MNQNAEYSAVNDAVRGQFFRKVWAMITPYWRSEEKGKAWTLLIAVIALSLISVGISVWFNTWYKDFYNALQKKDEAAFWQLILYFCAIAAVAIVGAVYRLYLTQMLTIRWRAWLTEKHFARWLADKNYYQLEQGGYTDNPDQRISEDLNNFTSNTLELGIGLMRNVVSLVSFSIILWGVSGSIEVLGITIPGYMFWCVLVYAVVGSWLTHLIGRRLIGLNNQQQRFEADLRFSMVRVRENAESIALYNGEPNEQSSLEQPLRHGLAQLLGHHEGVQASDLLHRRLHPGRHHLSVHRRCAALPRRQDRTGRTDADQLGVRQRAGELQLVHQCIPEPRLLARHLRPSVEFPSGHDRQRRARSRPSTCRITARTLKVHNLGLDLADGRHLLTNADMTVEEGERVMLSGRSGSGKSTLLRAMGHLWPSGPRQYSPAGGALSVPAAKAVSADRHLA